MAGPEGLRWEKLEFPFAAGLDTRTHPHLVEAPRLLRALNVEFRRPGGLDLRHPYGSIGLDILGGGTINPDDLRKVVAFGDELLLWTRDKLYSWSPALSKWVLKDSHLAVAVTETTRFDNANDQVFADRSQLGGVVVYTWVETQAGGAVLCYLAAADATSGAVVLAPVSFGAGPTRPRVVAVDTRVLVFWMEAGGLKATAFNPAAPAFTAAGATTVSTRDGIYDVVRDPAADRAVAVVRNATGTAYDIAKVTAGLVVSSSGKARACNGLIAVDVSPEGHAQVVRVVTAGGGGVDLKGDSIVVATLGDNLTDLQIGTAATANVNHLTCAHRSRTDAFAYRCYVFWSVDESAGDGMTPDFELRSNWIDTGGITGVEGTFQRRLGLASRAFNHDGKVYVWTVFAGESLATSGTLLGIQAPYQNTCFLYGDGGELVSKSTWQRAGGLGYYGAPGRVLGHLPGVALVSGTTGYAWCGIERQLVQTLNKVGRTYGARAPRDVLFTFDSDEARRTVQCGRTLYVSGGLLLQYDGAALTEVGFQLFPVTLSTLTGGGVPAIPAGTYSYKVSFRATNSRGEVERSTVATGAQVTLAGVERVTLDVTPLQVTRKQAPLRNVSIEAWRTVVNPASPVNPYYLVTGLDPAVQTGDNAYLENAPASAVVVSVADNYTDTILLTKEAHPENGGAVPRMAPPGATILASTDVRLFLAGVPGEPMRVWYSLLRTEGQLAAFSSLLSFDLPAGAGPVTGLAVWQETPVVFTATEAFAVVGDGYANVVGVGSNYTVRSLNVGVGALSHDTIVAGPGGLIFLSRKGWYRLNGAWAAEYIGAAVEAYNTSDSWVAAQVLETAHQVRVLSRSRMLVWDWSVGADGRGEWAEWTQPTGRGLTTWRGTPILVDNSAVKAQRTDFTGVDYDYDVEMAIHLQGLQGFARVKWVYVLGEFKADHQQQLRLGVDYLTTYVDDRTKAFTGLVAGNPTQLQHGPSQPRAQTIRTRVTIRDTNGNTPAYDAVTLTGLSVEVGFKPGLNKRVPATQKQ